MNKPYLLSLSICLLVFNACLALREPLSQFNECQLESLNALEPDNRIESEAGVTETWNPNHPELRCAGVTVIKRTIESYGLHLPSYTNAPQLIFIVQGELYKYIFIFSVFISFNFQIGQFLIKKN